MKPDKTRSNPTEHGEPLAAQAGQPDLREPSVVLSLLEADQVVAAKSEPFGRRLLSPGMRALLWGLRAYVVVMLVIVLISIVRAMHTLR